VTVVQDARLAPEGLALAEAVPPALPQARIVALIPAHNEEAGIAATVRSLLTQTRAPQRVIVMADNCSDRTVEVARQAGAEVHETVGNTAKKAGALNQGLRVHMADLQDTDVIVCMDADGALEPDFLEQALAVLADRPNVGGLSGAVVAREPQNFVEAFQAIEYARGTRLMARAGGAVHVLSGACAVFPVRVLRHVAQARGTLLPGETGTWFMEHSLTEDYELTLAIKQLGYACTSTRRCRVVTDVMPTMGMLATQRLRWYRGAMESLWLYGWSRLTDRIWLQVGFTFVASVLAPAALLILAASYLAWGAQPAWEFLLLLPLFVAEGVVVARRVGGWRAQLLAWTFLPLWVYDNLLFFYYWRSLLRATGGQSQAWVT
jgi:cellulose synthase/poly-beta-1,6-N-acetylglucosamine synthase-like glycosyltransferase